MLALRLQSSRVLFQIAAECSTLRIEEFKGSTNHWPLRSYQSSAPTLKGLFSDFTAHFYIDDSHLGLVDQETSESQQPSNHSQVYKTLQPLVLYDIPPHNQDPTNSTKSQPSTLTTAPIELIEPYIPTIQQDGL